MQTSTGQQTAPGMGESNGRSMNDISGSTHGQRGGRGRGRGGSGRGRGANDSQGNANVGRRGGRGGNGFRGPSTEANTMNAGDLAARFSSEAKPSGARIPNGNNGTENSDASKSMVGKTMAEGADESEAEVCFICASPVVHEALMPCNHRTCHICCLRMRALYKDKNCMHCRTPAPLVIFTDNATKRYEEFSEADISSCDDNIGIRYENDSIRDDTLILLRYNCPDADCDVACLGWPDLHRHVKGVHHKKICDLCSRHKKIFTHEHELYTDPELTKHMRKGDDNPGAVDQTGFKGHPICTFCNQRFYGEDELYEHCRSKHERCGVCEQLRVGAPQYYMNFEALSAHYRKDHFVCLERECLENKHIVFGSELDLKAHQLEQHGNTLSKDVRRDTAVVDISSFNYRTPYIPERRGGGSQREQRDGRGRGRGRDPNAEAIPASSAQPLRRDEQAFQRQMAIHSAQSIAPRTFGGQLTAPAPVPTRGPAAATSRPPNVDTPSQVINNSEPQAELTPQEQARQMRHRDVLERAANLLQNDNTKISQFRNSISSFKSNAITAPALIDSFFALFTDTTSSALGTLIREIADLYEDKLKSDALKIAWNNWRAINEDYPSLPAGSGSTGSSIPLNWAVTSSSSTGGGGSGNGGNVKSTRVLKLKSSTAQSSRSPVSQTRSWGSASPVSSPSVASSSANNPFPGLPAQKQNTNSTKLTTTPWVASSSSSSSTNNNTPRPTPPSSRPVSRGPVRNTGSDAFPALPPAARPQSTIFGPGARGMVRRDGGGLGMGMGRAPAGGNPWGPQAVGDEVGNEGEGAEEAGKGKKKGNKGKKVLVAWG